MKRILKEGSTFDCILEETLLILATYQYVIRFIIALIGVAALIVYISGSLFITAFLYYEMATLCFSVACGLGYIKDNGWSFTYFVIGLICFAASVANFIEWFH